MQTLTCEANEQAKAMFTDLHFITVLRRHFKKWYYRRIEKKGSNKRRVCFRGCAAALPLFLNDVTLKPHKCGTAFRSLLPRVHYLFGRLFVVRLCSRERGHVCCTKFRSQGRPCRRGTTNPVVYRASRRSHDRREKLGKTNRRVALDLRNRERANPKTHPEPIPNNFFFFF